MGGGHRYVGLVGMVIGDHFTYRLRLGARRFQELPNQEASVADPVPAAKPQVNLGIGRSSQGTGFTDLALQTEVLLSQALHIGTGRVTCSCGIHVLQLFQSHFRVGTRSY